MSVAHLLASARVDNAKALTISRTSSHEASPSANPLRPRLRRSRGFAGQVEGQLPVPRPVAGVVARATDYRLSRRAGTPGRIFVPIRIRIDGVFPACCPVRSAKCQACPAVAGQAVAGGVPRFRPRHPTHSRRTRAKTPLTANGALIPDSRFPCKVITLQGLFSSGRGKCLTHIDCRL